MNNGKEGTQELLARDVDLIPIEEGTRVLSSAGPAMMELSVLRQLAATADERVKAMAQIIRASVTACGRKDWVDLGGKPYPMEVGAERMARLWGVHVQILEGPDREDREDHYLYRCKVRVWSDLLGRSTEVVGMRSSKDPFFTARYERLPDGATQRITLRMEEVNERDVAMSSQTNAKVKGITEVLGLRGLTWEDLADYGITPEGAAGRVSYGAQETGLTDDQMRTQIRDWLLALHKGDMDGARAMLIETTGFRGKDGKDVPGVNSTSDLKGRRLSVTYGKVQKLAKAAGIVTERATAEKEEA